MTATGTPPAQNTAQYSPAAVAAEVASQGGTLSQAWIAAALADGICTLLLILGLFTRWASFILFVNVFVAWALVHHFALLGKGNDHGELIVLYLGGCVALFFLGAGKYSLDAVLDRS